MRRPINQIGQSIYDWYTTKAAQDTMVALGKLAAALIGTSTAVSGLAVTPTAPASLQVNVAPGEIYALTTLEASVYGSLPADTAHQIVKQGIALDTQQLACAAPSTSGNSINYLIQASFSEVDVSLDPSSGASPVVMQFYNADNPTQPWNGPNNSGQTSSTFRVGNVVLNAKAGIAATTGSQVTPAPDAGYVGLYVVTVANGQTTINSGNISTYAGAPIISERLGDKISASTGDVRYAALAGLASQVFAVAAATQSQHAAQMGQVIAATGAQCRLTNSGANLLLSRVKSGTIFIPGYGLATVPAGGVTLVPAGLTASTVYYIYAYMNGSTLTLEASTTARATDATTGIEIKSGDNTRLFVGMEYASGTTTWASMARSWYHDRGYVGSTTPNTTNTGSTTFVALASQKINFLAFAGELVHAAFLGITNTSTSGYSSFTQIAFDSSASATGLSTQVQSYASSPGNTLNYGEPSKITSDGLHYAQLLGKTDSGTSTWTGGMTVDVQPIGR